MAKDRAADATAELKPSCVCSASKPPGELGLVYAHVQDNTGEEVMDTGTAFLKIVAGRDFDPTAPEQPERNSQNGDPHNDCRRVHSRRPRISKNGTPEERTAKAALTRAQAAARKNLDPAFTLIAEKLAADVAHNALPLSNRVPGRSGQKMTARSEAVRVVFAAN